ncbi:MAG TPA: hypothetical protein VEQ87_04165 [Burkholderiales bacterium]|nr:hypothetical protein [Burkholderiales bacterium]
MSSRHAPLLLGGLLSAAAATVSGALLLLCEAALSEPLAVALAYSLWLLP